MSVEATPPRLSDPSRSPTAVPASTWVLAASGTILLGIGLAVELLDAEPRAQLWLGAAASAAFLLAVPITRGADARRLVARARLMIGAACSALIAVMGLWQVAERPAPSVLLLLVPVSLLFVTAGLALREAGAMGRRTRILALRARLDGEEAERRRWARELHDGTLQDLAAVEVTLAAVAARSDPQAWADGIAQTRAMVAAQIGALRRVINGMRPLALDTLGLGAALSDLAGRAGGVSGLRVRCDVAGLPRLPVDAEANLYRIVQEALTNATRHSGGSAVTVTARAGARELTITVQDDGGTARIIPGRGIRGMYERAEALAARLEVANGSEGTVVTLHLPLGGWTAPLDGQPVQ